MYLEFRKAIDTAEQQRLSTLQHQTRAGDTHFPPQPLGSHTNVRHFGLFELDGKPAGYVSVVEAFAGKHILQSRRPLPFMQYIRRKNRVHRVLNRVIENHGMVVEIAIVLGTGMHHAHLTRHIVESLIAVYGVGLQVPVLLVCPSEFQRLYEDLGFRRLFRCETLLISEDPASEGICMYAARPQSTGVVFRLHRLLQMYCRYGATGFRVDRSDMTTPQGVHPVATQSILQLALRDSA